MKGDGGETVQESARHHVDGGARSREVCEMEWSCMLDAGAEPSEGRP
jgi:hypothetical protein